MGMAGMCYENNRVGSLPHVQIVKTWHVYSMEQLTLPSHCVYAIPRKGL